MNLLQFDSEASWVDGVCAFWRDRLRTRPATRVCLSTGLTPVPVYAQMARSVRAGDVSFADAHIFALDEFGGLPPDDPGNTRNTLLRQLVSSVDLPKDAFRYLDAGAADTDEQCREYDRAIGTGFDLVILGLGLNGHLGMNEPGSSPASPTRRVELHETTIQASARYFKHGQLPRWGLTVGLRAILASAEVWVLAAGGAKADIVRKTVHGDVSPQVPASLLREHGNCSLFVDPAAGEGLCRRS
jgi:glucosamine-6-phosphate deaminase